MNAFDLTGKTAFVTGAFGGLGLHFATVLATHGAKVAIAGRRIELGRTVAAGIGAALARPDDGFNPASDSTSDFLGRINRVYGVKGKPSPGGNYAGKYGFIFE